MQALRPHRPHLTPVPSPGKASLGISCPVDAPEQMENVTQPEQSTKLGTEVALRGYAASWVPLALRSCSPAHPARPCAASGPLTQVDAGNEFTVQIARHFFFLIVRLFIMCTILLIFHISSVCMLNFVMGNSIAAVNINGI